LRVVWVFLKIMSELQQYATQHEVLVFDGKKIHKNAISKKGKPTVAHAALLTGKLEDELSESEAVAIIERMSRVKNGFSSRVRHLVGLQWVERARNLGMKCKVTGRLVTNLAEMIEELESNATVENFQMWYAICYKDSESGANAKRDAEAILMKEMQIHYHDNTMVNGCIGQLRIEAVSSLKEKIQARSKVRQGLHVVKSKPVSGDDIKGKRRGTGDYYVVHSDKKGRMLSRSLHNVCPYELVTSMFSFPFDVLTFPSS
jgi:hypothetical protein